MSLETQACSEYNRKKLPILNALKTLLLLLVEKGKQIMRPISLKDLKSSYERFNEEQKIAFILAGGAPRLLALRRRTRASHQEARGDTFPSDPLTGALPVIS